MVIGPGRQNHRSRPPGLLVPFAIARDDREAVFAIHSILTQLCDGLSEIKCEVKGIDDLPVVPQGFVARRLLVRRRERQTTDLEQLGRGEEHHLGRKMEE